MISDIELQHAILTSLKLTIVILYYLHMGPLDFFSHQMLAMRFNCFILIN